MKRKLFVGAIVLGAMGAVWAATRSEAVAADESDFPPPVSAEGVTNRLGCKLVGDDGMETAVGFWPCVQAWVYADFGALHSGQVTEVPAHVVAQMKASTLSDKMGRIFFDNWTISRMEIDGEDFISVHGWGFKKNGYQMQMENFVPFRHGQSTTKFITTTPDGETKVEYIMDCFLDMEGLE